MQLKKLFVVTRSDLPFGQQAVQSGHALAELLMKKRDHSWTNGTLVFLKTDDLQKTMDRLDRDSQSYYLFREPDQDNAITAIASLADPKYFKGLKLI